MKKLIEPARYACVFAASVALLLLLFVATEFIDKDSMRENMLSSAKTLCENTVGVEIWEKVAASKLDRYADCISLNIAWHTDSENPFASAMWTSFSRLRDPDDYYGANRDLYDAVSGDIEANTQYLRYWHGSVVFIRLFHLFMDITGMYAAASVFLLILFIVLIVKMWRLGMRGEIVCLGLASAMAAVWFVPLCLEYYWVFLIAFSAAIIALKLGHKGRWELVPALFMVSGILTNYLDFLTTEILTLLIPLLLLLALSGHEGFRQDTGLSPLKLTVKACVFWGIGYLGMWMMKWITASAILGMNVMPYVTDHIAQRIGAADNVAGNPLSAIFVNLITILPAGLGDMGAILCIIALAVLGSILFVYKKKSIRKDYVLAYAAAGLLPYLRYAVLSEHSFRHFCFTYRAQMATVLAVGLITLEVADGRLFRRKSR